MGRTKASRGDALGPDVPAMFRDGARSSPPLVPLQPGRRARLWRLRRHWLLSPRFLGWLLGGLAGAVVLSLPAPTELGHLGFSTLAVTVAAVVWWAVDVGAGASALVYTLVLFVIGEPVSLTLAGWREPGFWFFGAMLFYGIAMTSTGLDRRIAHAVLANVRPSYSGLLFAFGVIGFVLALLIPTMRVRMAVLASISLSVSQAIGRPRRSRESLLLAFATWVAAVIPGLAVPAVGLGAGRVRDALSPDPVGGLSWVGWVALFAGPAILLTVIALLASYLVLRPQRPLAVTRNYFRHRQLRLGRPDYRERVALLIFLVSLAAWITREWHGIAESYIAVAGVMALIGSGALPVRHLVQWPLWSTLVFFATLFALPQMMAHQGITAWLGGYLEPIVHVGTESIILLVIFFISARSSTSWAPVGRVLEAERDDSAPRTHRRGRVRMDVQGSAPSFVYVHEVKYARPNAGGRRVWAARVRRAPRAGESRSSWPASAASRSGVSAAGRSGRVSLGGPWRRL